MTAVPAADGLAGLVQPLVEQLREERARTERLHRENLELAGRLGFYQARLQEADARILALTAGTTAPPGAPAAPSTLGAAPAAPPPCKPPANLWQRLRHALTDAGE